MSLPSIATAQPTVDGTIDESEYQLIGQKQNMNDSFSGGTDLRAIYKYADTSTDTLYLGFVGTLSTGNNNGIGIWLNVLGPGAPDGRPAGTPLAVTGGGHYISGNGGTNSDFAAGFDVDVMYAFNSGGGTSDVFFDAAQVTGSTDITQFVGSSDQSGTLASGSGPGGSTINFATDNSGASLTGIEMAIPFAELDATSDMFVQVSGVVVSSSAFFSNETVPGDYTGSSQPGFDADFGGFSGGPYFTTESQLPVELANFRAMPDGASTLLTWRTLSETGNDRFEIEHAAPGRGFRLAGTMRGQGTTVEATDYQFRVDDLAPGTHRFRLRQVDVDGTTSLSSPRSVTIGVQGIFLSKAAPHPVAGGSTFGVSVDRTSPVRVEMFNLLGQRVRTLFDGTVTPAQPARIEMVTGGLAAGTYFIRATNGTASTVQRVTVVQ